MNTTQKLTKTQTAALTYITERGAMWIGQQGLGSLPNGAKALAAKGILKIEAHTDAWGNTGQAYKLA